MMVSVSLEPQWAGVHQHSAGCSCASEHGKRIPESRWAHWADCSNELWMGWDGQQLSKHMAQACKGAWLSSQCQDKGLDLWKGLTNLSAQSF